MEQDASQTATSRTATSRTATSRTATSRSDSPLRRSSHDRMVGGVAGGVAEHFGLDPTVVRVGALLACVLGGFGVPLYAAAWLLLPEEGSDASLADELLGRSAA